MQEGVRDRWLVFIFLGHLFDGIGSIEVCVAASIVCCTRPDRWTPLVHMTLCAL